MAAKREDDDHMMSSASLVMLSKFYYDKYRLKIKLKCLEVKKLLKNDKMTAGN